MIITIDGPAGAGKSSAARGLAQRIGFRFLDTGAMYRAVALDAMRRQIPWDDADRLAAIVGEIEIDVTETRVMLDGEDVTQEIRKIEVTSMIHHVADNHGIRTQLVELQRNVASTGDYVTEGRDQGTIAFPNAECKIFLTASPDERARRRMKDLHDRGERLEFEEVFAQQYERDVRDLTRDMGRLEAATDAVTVSTDGKTLDQVVDELEELARERCNLAN